MAFKWSLVRSTLICKITKTPSLKRDKILALSLAKGSFDKKMKVSQAGKMDILWQVINIEDSFNPVQSPNCSFFLNDASTSGWGAIFDKETTGGHFSLDEYITR